MTDFIGSPVVTGALAETKNKVLRNTYGLLALSLLPTIAGSWVGVASGVHLTGMMGLLIFMAGAFGFMYAIEKK